MIRFALILTAVVVPQLAFAQAPAASPALDFGFYRTRVEPMFLIKRPGNIACIDCHGRGAGALRLMGPAEGQTAFSEEASRKNIEALSKFIVPGSPRASRFLRHPLAHDAGGDAFHGGGKHWNSVSDPEYQTLVAWVSGATNTTKPSGKTVVRIIQTNAAGDNAHLIDPETNKVVGVINDIQIPHGVTSAPDGTRIYITNEHGSTLDIVDGRSLSVIRRVPLSGRPNNVAVSKDGRRVYVGIAQAPGAVDVIDTASMTNVKSIPVKGAIHNVYVTPDGKYAVAGSIPTSTISVIDTTTNELAWTIQMSAGIRPMIFDTNADGSTRNIYVQLSNFHGFAVVDWNARKEIARIEHPAVPGAERHTDGLQGAPAHGLGVSPDGKTLWSTSKLYGYAYVHSLPDLKEIGRVFVGQHPEWVTFTPDGKYIYIAAAGDNQTFVVHVKTMKEVARVNVGQVPKRNGTAVLQVE